jgi:hypothetical protein
MRILTINCGSSTLKFELFEAAQCLREDRAPTLISECESLIARAAAYSRDCVQAVDRALKGPAKLAMSPHRPYLHRRPLYGSGGAAEAFMASRHGE